jgi:hypothetical protein
MNDLVDRIAIENGWALPAPAVAPPPPPHIRCIVPPPPEKIDLRNAPSSMEQLAESWRRK